MPGTIQVSVLGLIDVQTSSPGSSNTSIKVAMGKLEYQTSDSGDYIFPVTRLRENLIVTLLDVNGNQILQKEIETRMIIESGFLEEKLSFNGYGNVQLKMQFVLSEEDRNRIRFLRQSALRKKHEELVNGSSFTKSKSIASDLSSLSSMQSRDIVAVASSKTNLGLSQETKLKTNADRDPVSSNLIMWKPEVKDSVEKTNIQLSSSDVSSSKKVPEVKKLESVSLVKQEDKGLNKPSKKLIEAESVLLVKQEDKGLSKPRKKFTEAKTPESVSLVKQEETGLSKPERKPKRKSMRRSMSDSNLNNVRKMISNFEVKVTQDTKIRTAKIQTDSCKDAEEKTKAQPPAESTVNLEKSEERKIISFNNMEKSVCSDNTDRCDDLVIVSRDERTMDIEDKSLEHSTRRSDLLSTQRRSLVVEVRDDEKKQNKSVWLKDSQLENARGSRLWIFPDEAKDLCCETDLGTRHLDLDLAEANLLQKRIDESTRENIGERGSRCINIAKINSNNKWTKARELRKEGHKVVVLEQNEDVGGQWFYQPNVEEEDPLGRSSGSINGELKVHSSIYSSLRLTSPREIMGYSDFPFLAKKGRDMRRFPGHKELWLYLKDFSEAFGLREMIRFNVRVEFVGEKEEEDDVKKWIVRSREKFSGKVMEEIFDAVVVATGHYSHPRLPSIKGMDSWKRKQIHSHVYRVPDPFRNEVVVVVGNSMSGQDISMELVEVAKEVHLSAKTLDISSGLSKVISKHPNLLIHPQIESLEDDGKVIFVDGSWVVADTILYCTGYSYKFPFLESKGRIEVDDDRVGPLFEHTFPPCLSPSLSFVGIPRKLIGFPFFEAQAKWIAQVLSGKSSLPSPDQMLQSVDEFYRSRDLAGVPKHNTHDIADFTYCDKYADYVGFPHLEDWRKLLCLSALNNSQENLETYRDSWDDHELLQEALQSSHFTNFNS